MQTLLYFHTIRHLRAGQILSRIAFRLRTPRPDGAAAPSTRMRVGQWVAGRDRRTTQLSSNRFRFLNVEHEIARASDWNHPEWEKLWLYNLHYFDDIDSPDFAATAERWIAQNPPGKGNGWEPYPISLRVVNWIKWALAGNALSAGMRDSLAVQCRYLMQRLEWHLLGNHLFANAKGLLFAGSYFDGPEAGHWLARGQQILRRELPEQVLADGAHFELSPMYHAIILEDILDLINLGRVFPGIFSLAALQERAAPMLTWLTSVTHPDGEIAFFNDAAIGIASAPAEILAYARRVGIEPSVSASPVRPYPSYLRLQAGPACAIVDVAAIGPDYLPGHAHADTLSFELSLGLERVIVNSGTSTYASSDERLRQRATAAHSTLEIDGENSSEVWSSFRVARRAYPSGLKVTHEENQWTVSCAHEGYRRLRGRPIHRREWRLDEHHLSVKDTVEGKFRRGVARFHFHPDCAVTEFSERGGTLRTANGISFSWSIDGGRGRIVESTYHPGFGVTLPNRCLEVETVDTPLTTHFNWRGSHA